MPLFLPELIADESGQIRFDPGLPDDDQAHSDEERDDAPAEVTGGEHGMAGDVSVREPEDGAIAAEKAIGEPSAHHRHRVRGGDEVMVDALRGIVLPAEELLHVRDEDGAHPVEAEPFAGLVPDDVFDCRRQLLLTSHSAAPGSGL